MQLRIVVWGQPHTVWIPVKQALTNAVDDALVAAGVADIYRRHERWELRSESGTLIETYRSPESLGMGDCATLFLSPRAGVGG